MRNVLSLMQKRVKKVINNPTLNDGKEEIKKTTHSDSSLKHI